MCSVALDATQRISALVAWSRAAIQDGDRSHQALSARLAPNQRYSDNVLGTQVSSTCNPETQRSTGGDYVADCTKPDDVEPARRRLIQPVGWVGSIFQLIS